MNRLKHYFLHNVRVFDSLLTRKAFTMYKLCIILISISFIVSSCKNSAELTTNYEDGSIQERFEINKDSLKHGLYTLYRPGGSVAETANYKNGILNGERKLVYENGNNEIIENYVNDKLHGVYRTFYPTGKKELEMNYVDGVIEGISKKYYESGKLSEEVSFENNNENGPFVEYYENGNKKWEGTFLNGDNEVGLLMNYNEEGNLIKKMMCNDMSVCQTVWTIEEGDIDPVKLFDKG